VPPRTADEMSEAMLTGANIVESRRHRKQDKLVSAGASQKNQVESLRIARLAFLGELATTVVHEVTQPLAAISVDAETILILLSQAEPDVAKLRKVTERLAESARRAGVFTKCVRDMASGHQIGRERVDLNEVVSTALQLIQHNIEESSIAVETVMDPKPLPLIGDRVQLEQVVTNLLVNAVQALRPKEGLRRRIEVFTRFERGRASFIIRDNGVGIADGDCKRIFQNHFTTKAGGLGLGLAICQSIIIAHGGSISARNFPEGGAEFEFWIPVCTGGWAFEGSFAEASGVHATVYKMYQI
jgi:two-component system sensor kinase FixL